MSQLLVELITPNATIPTKGSEKAAGWDLYSAVDVIIAPTTQCLVKTNLRIRVPPGTYGRIAPRSGLAYKNFIGIGAGVLDADFCGDVGVIIFNHGSSQFQVKKGDRIAQLILEKYDNTSDIKVVDKLDETKRGECGFGSTGL
jgi:dUTP pyrophosphatase